MAGDEPELGGLTRALLLGAAVGTLPLIQVGCAAVPAATQAVNPAIATDQELCARVLASRSARDAEVLIRTYPGASCIPPALAALPPNALAAISPAALGRIAPEVRARIPAETARYLRVEAAATADLFEPGDGDRGGSGPY